MRRFVADLGNSRIKWAESTASGLVGHVAVPIDDADAWTAALREISAADWAVSSVNPPLSSRFGEILDESSAGSLRWFRAASEIPIRYEVEGAETGGADRALAVLAASAIRPAGRAFRVVLCGTAITVERASAEGVWQGGSIAPGLRMSARALHHFTAGLPLIDLDGPPPDWGRATVPSVHAGVVWGTVGLVRELIARQAIGEAEIPWIAWSGGDAATLARLVDGPDAVVVPDLVLRGVAVAAFSG